MRGRLKMCLTLLLCAVLLLGSAAVSAEEIQLELFDDDQTSEAMVDEVLDLEAQTNEPTETEPVGDMLLPSESAEGESEEPEERMAEQNEPTASSGDFEIKDGVLVAYHGTAEKVIVPKGVKGIGNQAFYANHNMTSVTIPKGVTSIGEEAFHYCDGLETVNLPDTLTSIETLAFSDCMSLKSLKIPESVTGIAELVFVYYVYDRYDYYVLPDLTLYVKGGSFGYSYAVFYGIPYSLEAVSTKGPTSITLNKTGTVSMKKSKTLQLKATWEPKDAETKLTWESSDTKVAKVNKKGVVTALKKGAATITCTTDNGKSAKMKILVDKVATMEKPTVKRKSNNSVTVSWTSLNGVDGYEIVTDGLMLRESRGAAYRDPLIVKGQKKTAVVYVTPFQKICYKVRGYLDKGNGKRIYGKWSNGKTFTLKREIPKAKEVMGKEYRASAKNGGIKYTVTLLDWKYEEDMTTIQTRVDFEWTKTPNFYGTDVIAMGVTNFTLDQVDEAIFEYATWTTGGASGSLNKKHGYFTKKVSSSVENGGNGVFIKFDPVEIWKDENNKKRQSCAVAGHIVATWSLDASKARTNFGMFASYGDSKVLLSFEPKVKFSDSGVSIDIGAVGKDFKEGKNAYLKVKIKQ